MPRRIFLHVGPPKTATTYLQNVLSANQAVLAEHGITVLVHQAPLYNAASELLERRPRRARELPRGAWRRLCGEVEQAPGDVIVSCERFSLFRPAHAAMLLDSVFGRSELHVVLTLRDVTAVLPSWWQERAKNGGTQSWPQFCRRAQANPAALARMTRLELPVATWGEALPPERVRVVTVPPPGLPGLSRDVVLERFCAVVGADPASLVVGPGVTPNSSVGLVGGELIRRLNDHAGGRMGPRIRHLEVKRFLAEEVLNRGTTRRPQLPPSTFEVARAHQERVLARIRTAGFPVEGDLAELTSTPPPDPSAPAAPVTDAELLDAALDAITALARRSYRRHQRLTTAEQPRAYTVLRSIAHWVRRRRGGVRRRGWTPDSSPPRPARQQSGSRDDGLG